MPPQLDYGFDGIEPAPRLAARVVLLRPNRNVLLLRAFDKNATAHWWVMPGGGLQPGESFEEAAVREAFEETGLNVVVSECIWTRHHRFEIAGKVINQYEQFFVAKTESMSIKPISQDNYISGHRWWTEKEIRQSSDQFAPGRLGELITPVLNGVYPSPAIDCGV